jgi:hypothetical protein
MSRSILLQVSTENLISQASASALLQRSPAVGFGRLGALARLGLFYLERSHHHPPEREEIVLARRGRPPSQSNGPLRLWLDEAQQLYPLVADFNVDCYFRQERNTIAARHHLHDSCKAGGAEAGIGAGAAGTVGQRLLA